MFSLCRFLLRFLVLTVLIRNVEPGPDLLFTDIHHTQHEPLLIGRYPWLDTQPPVGILIRNGFGKFSTSGYPLHEFNHLFDSLSLILKFNFTKTGEVYYQSRMQLTRYYNESQRTVPLFRTLGGFSPNFTTEQALNTLEHGMHDNLNAHIIPIGSVYMAISDLQGGNLLNPQTLEYIGNRSSRGAVMSGGWLEYRSHSILSPPQVGGNLCERQYLGTGSQAQCLWYNYITSTHPISRQESPHVLYNYDAVIRVHPENATIQYEYRFYRQDTARLDSPKVVFYTIPTPRLAYVHSFSLTANYLIFFEYPMFWDIPAMSIHTSILQTFKWDPTRKTQIYVIRVGSEGPGVLAMQLETEPFFAFHHVNSFESANGGLVVDILTYPNGSIFDRFYLSDLRRGGPLDAKYPAGLAVRFSWDFDNPRVRTRILSDQQMELPAINPMDRGRPYRHFYAVGNDYSVYRVDVISGDSANTVKWSQPGQYPSEPVFIPPGYLASVTLDANRNISYLLILDTSTMEETLAKDTVPQRLWLDTWIPLTCHGSWIPAGNHQ